MFLTLSGGVHDYLKVRRNLNEDLATGFVILVHAVESSDAFLKNKRENKEKSSFKNFQTTMLHDEHEF